MFSKMLQIFFLHDFLYIKVYTQSRTSSRGKSCKQHSFLHVHEYIFYTTCHMGRFQGHLRLCIHRGNHERAFQR